MNKRMPLRITVMRKMNAREVFGENLPEIVNDGHEACRRTKVGQEFIVREDGLMPCGFCSYGMISVPKWEPYSSERITQA